MENLVLPLVGMVLGGVITWWVARHYFFKAAQQLTEEVTPLLQRTNAILRGLEIGGIAEFARDASGNYTGGVVIKMAAAAGGYSVGGASLSTVHAPDDPPTENVEIGEESRQIDKPADNS
jgi:hypothetical protein